MKHYVVISCPNCGCEDTTKNGHTKHHEQRYLCNNKDCSQKSFRLDYRYNAYVPGVKDKIIEQSLNSSGVRDVSRNLKIAKGTVINELKKKEPAEVNPYLIDKIESGKLRRLEVEICYETEWDEYWSFVGSKSNQRWTWYIVERNSGIIVAWQNGRRTDASLEKLVKKVAHLPLDFCYTDGLDAYARQLPEDSIHIVGKANTWKIERKNLNFRTHIKRLTRRTICFSKNEKIHDNIIGLYIEKYYFKDGTFTNALKRLNQRV